MTVENELRIRCQSKCELCSAEGVLQVYEVPPVQTKTVDKCVMLCGQCLETIDAPAKTDGNHWRCLSDSMWSSEPAVQIMAWRVLKQLDLDWAQDLLQQLYLDEDMQKWAESGLASKNQSNDHDDVILTRDSNGTVLADGDSVTLIKDLEVKGANFTAKRGTVVKNISLTANPEHIEGRVNGTQIVLLTCFLKKAS